MRYSRDDSALKGFSVTYLAVLGALVLFIVLMGVMLVWRGLNPVTVASHLHHH